MTPPARPRPGAADPATGLSLARHSLDVILRWQTAGGAFLAGPTFSQYGYSWFRDSAFIAEALDVTGRVAEAARFHDWAARVVLESADGMARAADVARSGGVPGPDDYLHCRYAADGSRGPDDWPTFQLDGPGIWLWSLAHHARHGGTVRPVHAQAAVLVARYLVALRDTPASDAWEESPERVHTSTLGAMLAGLRAILSLGLDEPAVARCRADLEAHLLGPGATWTKWPGNDGVDGSLLWMVAPYELAPADAPPAARLIARVEDELEDADGGVHRYRRDTYYGGGAWVILAVALARARLRRGRPGDRALAARSLAWVESLADASGDLPEQTEARAFHPARIAAWREAWGESARPLLWSHAAHLVLRAELGLPQP